MTKRKVTILYDGEEDVERAEAQASGESISLVCEQVKDAIISLGHEARLLAADHDIRKLAGRIDKDDSDLIFNLCESLGGKSQYEQNVAALLEVLGGKFTGAGSIGLALAQDKALSKKIFSFHGIRYPKFSVMDGGHVEWSDDLEFPLIVKPATEDASVGIDSNAIVQNVKELMERISYIHTDFKTPVLIEEFIEGREIYAGILGNDKPEALPLLEWDFSGIPDNVPKIASSEAKWDSNSAYKNAVEIFPNDIPEAVCEEIQAAAIQAFKSLKLRDYGRVDVRLRQAKRDRSMDGWEFYIIEVNPNPYLDQKSEFAMAARKHGLAYPDLIERIIEMTMERNT